MKAYAPGDRVQQAQYGAGTVTAVNEYHTIIAFDEHGSRTFSTRIVQLQPSETPEPPKKPARTVRRRKVAEA